MKKLVALVLSLCLLMSVGSVALADDTITLRFSWWGGDSRHQATMAVIEQYMELHPNVKIEA